MIELSEMIRELRQELINALTDGSGGPLRFELGPVEVEATVAVGRKGGAQGKVRFWVVESAADVAMESSRTHRITLTLKPTLVAPDGVQHSALISGDEALGER